MVAEARQHKRGIYAEPCTQTENKQHRECQIKGNINRNEKTYFLSTCPPYKEALVQLYLGDQWFCTEKEAQAVGFKPSEACA